MRLNPIAVVMWIMCFGIGYLIGGVDTGILWVVVAMGIGFLLTLLGN